MTHEASLLNGRHRIENILAEKTVSGVCIDSEITHTEAREILEEVGP